MARAKGKSKPDIPMGAGFDAFVPTALAAQFSKEVNTPTPDWPPEPGEVDILHRPELLSLGMLTLEQRRRLVDQAIFVLEQTYVHRSLKHAIHAVDPVLKLKVLRERLLKMTEADLQDVVQTNVGYAELSRPRSPEIEFHRELTGIFNTVRDRHTNYHRPKPFRNMIAFLPFDVERYYDDQGRSQIIIARVYERAVERLLERKFRESELHGRPRESETFQAKMRAGFDMASLRNNLDGLRGARIVLWNGMPVEFAVERNADEHAGSNSEARLARGLERLTTRPLMMSPVPHESFVTMNIIGKDDEHHEAHFPWMVTTLPDNLQGTVKDALRKLGSQEGLDPEVDLAQRARGVLLEKMPLSGGTGSAGSFAGNYRARTTHPTKNGKPYGYLRIFSFLLEDEEDGPSLFVESIRKTLASLPQDGLIIDVRGNGGGTIPAGEQLLQLFTPRTIEPEPFQFIITPVTRELCRRAQGSEDHFIPDLSPWRESVDWGLATGSAFSRGHPITDVEAANEIGQVYHGPVVLIADANCYSTTDIFVAGFKDHKIGPIVGTDRNTGAGGANVWSHTYLSALLQETKASEALAAQGLRPAPFLDSEGAEIRVAVRRSLRVGDYSGMPVEDLGIVPDYHYLPTRDDVLDCNCDLIDAAAELLWKHEVKGYPPRLTRLGDGPPTWPKPVVRRLDVEVDSRDKSKLVVKIKARKVDRVDIFVDGRPEETRDLDGNRPKQVTLPRRRKRGPLTMDVRGFDRGELVASRRLRIR